MTGRVAALGAWSSYRLVDAAVGRSGSIVADLGVGGNSMVGNAQLSPALAAERLTTASIPEAPDYGLGIMQFGCWYGHAGEAIGWEDIVVHHPRLPRPLNQLYPV